MKFKKWIQDQGGPRAVGRLLGVESPTIYAWMRGGSTPKALVMQKLVELGRGAFSYDDIINETKRNAGGQSEQRT